MNWIVFILNAWVLLGLEIGLKDALRIGETPVAPSFVMPPRHHPSYPLAHKKALAFSSCSAFDMPYFWATVLQFCTLLLTCVMMAAAFSALNRK